jgi:hypothetical protein
MEFRPRRCRPTWSGCCASSRKIRDGAEDDFQRPRPQGSHQRLHQFLARAHCVARRGRRVSWS